MNGKNDMEGTHLMLLLLPKFVHYRKFIFFFKVRFNFISNSLIIYVKYLCSPHILPFYVLELYQYITIL